MLISSFIFGQSADNRFQQEEQTVQEMQNSESNIDAENAVEASGPGNPGEPVVPIDDYILLLLLTGAGLIIGLHYRKRLQTK